MANFYFLNTGNTDFNTGSNWSDTDGGTPVNAVPGTLTVSSSDDVFFTALSGDCIVTTTRYIKNLNCTGYTKTLSLSFALITTISILLDSRMKIVASNLVTPSNGRLGVQGTVSVTTAGVVIPYFALYGVVNSVITLFDKLNVSISLIYVASATATFAGAFGFETPVLSNPDNNGGTQTLQAGITYKTGVMNCNNNKSTLHGKIVSSDSTTHQKAILTVTGEINIAYTDFTDINASGGRPLYTFNGIVTNSDNIFTMTDAPVPADTTQESSMII